MHLKQDAQGNFYWKPNARQEDFLALPWTLFEALYGGAAGGGKSELLLGIPIVCGMDKDSPRFYEVPTFKGILFRRTFPQLEESLIPRSKEAYPKFGGRYNDTKHFWTFPSGAIVRFSYLDKDEDARDHDTAEYNYAGFDELTHFTEFMYTYILSRVRTSDPRLPAFARAATNPGNIGHTWVKNRFIKAAPKGYAILEDKRSHQRRIFIPAKLKDNVDLVENDPGYVHRLELLPEAERRAKLDGDWDIYEGQVFGEFRRRRLVSEPENACHFCTPFEIPTYWPKVLAIDWGYTAKTVGLLGAIAPDERVFLFKRYAKVGAKISEWASDIARMVQPYQDHLRLVSLDPSAWQQRGDDLTIAAQFHKYSKLIPIKADNDRLGGKQLLHDHFRWTPKPPRYVPPEGYQYDTAMRIWRVFGDEAKREYENLFVPEVPETNLPKLQVFDLPEFEEWAECIQSCVYVSKATAKKVRKEDVEEFDGDDDYDCTRYFLKAISRFINESKKEFDKLVGRDKVMTAVESGEMDMTNFYMQAPKLIDEPKQRLEGAIRRRGSLHWKN